MDPAWLTGIGTLALAFVTAILAGVTVWSVRENIKANRLLREENKRLHEQDRNRLGKLEALNTISNWVDEAHNILREKMFSLDSLEPVNEFLNKIMSTIDIDKGAVDFAGRLFEEWFQNLVSNTLATYEMFLKSVFTLRDIYLFKRSNDLKDLKEQIIKQRLDLVNAVLRLQRVTREHRITLLT